MQMLGFVVVRFTIICRLFMVRETMVNYTNLTCSNCKKKSLSSFFASTLNDANKELTKEVNRWRATCKVINKVTN